ncbi:MAG TPA: GTPase, partial [Pseudonocardiaceae bacterium]
MTADLYAAARAVLTDCAAAYRDSPRATALLRRHLGRLDEPVRVAVTGPPGIGCSTLVAALDGSRALRDTVITDGAPDEADAVLHLVRDRSTPLPVPPAALPAPVATIAVLCRTD